VANVTILSHESDQINFGDVPQSVNVLLQQGVVAYRRDRAQADVLFRMALGMAPEQLPVYFCLYKIHAYQGNLDQAQMIAEEGLSEASRQAVGPMIGAYGGVERRFPTGQDGSRFIR
jgi:Tfp pilus assembly protein PilF